MDVAAPHTVVMSPGTGAVLRALVGTTRDLSLRELGRIAGVSHTRARQAVEHLAEHGLVEVDRTPSGHRCRFNPDHLAADAVVALVSMRARLLDALTRDLGSWSPPPLHASLFGSAARGDGDTNSDLDLLVVQPDDLPPDDDHWAQQLHDSATRISRWTGNEVAWFVIDRETLARARATDEPALAEWLVDGILLAGVRLEQLSGEVGA